MRVLVHLGFNKCASTFVQHALFSAGPALAKAGVAYPGTAPRTCHYGLSRHYGFGPEAQEIMPTTLMSLLDQANDSDCDKVILSSEYLSLCHPAAAARLVADMQSAGVTAEYILFSRPLLGWISALFNQYVKTVDDGRALPNINAFVDQVLHNRAVDLAARYRMWEGLVGKRHLSHYRLTCGTGASGAGDVLAPFSAFAGCNITPPPTADDNRSLNPHQLFGIQQLRAEAPGHRRDREIDRLLGGGAVKTKAPADFLTISPDRMTRLRTEIEDPYLALPWQNLPTSDQSANSGQSVRQIRFNGSSSFAKPMPERSGILAHLERYAGRAINTAQTRSEGTNVERSHRSA